MCSAVSVLIIAQLGSMFASMPGKRSPFPIRIVSLVGSALPDAREVSCALNAVICLKGKKREAVFDIRYGRGWGGCC